MAANGDESEDCPNLNNVTKDSNMEDKDEEDTFTAKAKSQTFHNEKYNLLMTEQNETNQGYSITFFKHLLPVFK